MDKEAINEIITFLKSALESSGVKVDSIALFGSASSGKMDKDSDMDLIIISSDFMNLDIFERAKITMEAEMKTLRKYKIPMDVINLSPEEFEDSNLRKYSNAKIVA